ncbi:hypothetical protein TPA0909_21690 [Streptomyces albus]|nr:hypothetical protein TPA0909_21690 [Streptomyces albus]
MRRRSYRTAWAPGTRPWPYDDWDYHPAPNTSPHASAAARRVNSGAADACRRFLTIPETAADPDRPARHNLTCCATAAWPRRPSAALTYGSPPTASHRHP